MTYAEFERLETKITTSLIGTDYKGNWGTEKELEELVGKPCYIYDNHIDDGVDSDETEDTYVMVSCFEFKGINLVVRVYYGDVTEEITYVDVDYGDIFDEEEKEEVKEKVYVVTIHEVADYAEFSHTPKVFRNKEKALAYLKEEYEYAVETFDSDLEKEFSDTHAEIYRSGEYACDHWTITLEEVEIE